jgi:hypothetical protein
VPILLAPGASNKNGRPSQKLYTLKITFIEFLFMKSTIFRVAVFNIPDAIEGSLPVVKTVTMSSAEYSQIVSGAGVIAHNPDYGAWFVTISVGESDIRRVKVGQPAALKGAAFDEEIYTATVYDIDSLAVNRQGEFVHETVVEVILKIDNPDDELRSGYSARADIKTDQTRTIHIIPYSAILQDDIGEFVYVLSGNTAVRRNILTGIELADGAQVVAGLSEDDEVIASPESVAEGQLITTEGA